MLISASDTDQANASFGPHTLEVKKKMSSRPSVLRCTAGRSWGRHPVPLQALYTVYIYTVYRANTVNGFLCASSWMSTLSDNKSHEPWDTAPSWCMYYNWLHQVYSNCKPHERIKFTIACRSSWDCYRQTAWESSLSLPWHSHCTGRQTIGGNFTKRQPRTAHKVSSPMSKEVQLARDNGRYRKASWHWHCRSRTDHIGPTAMDRYLSNIHFRLKVEDHQLNKTLPAARVIAATRTLTGLQAVLTLHDYNACQVVRVPTDSKSLIQRLAQGPARQTDTTCSSISTVLATIGRSNLVSVQWIWDTWVWKVIQKQTLKPREALH